MRRLRIIVLAVIALTAIVWAAGWGKRDANIYGSPTLARWIIFAAERFVDTKFAPFGLPVHRPGAPPYTHLTPGAEWILTSFAWLRRIVARPVPPFLWHSLLTTALSAAAMVMLRRAVANMTAALRLDDPIREERATLSVLLLATTPSFVIFAPSPFCAGTFLANVLAFAAAASWAVAPRDERWPAALARIAAALFAAFWLGSAPLVPGLIWTLAAIVRFGEPARRARRVITFALVNVGVLAVAFALKFLQSLLLLGSVDAMLRDYQTVLAFRTELTVDYTLVSRSRDLLVTGGYLFGLPLLVLLLLILRSRSLARREALFLGAMVSGVLAWPILMPGHVQFHQFMLRDGMVPLALFLSLFMADRQRRALEWCALGSILVVAGVFVLPLVIAGVPLWKLLTP